MCCVIDLLQELIKHTESNDHEKKSLEKALEETQVRLSIT